MKFHVPSELRVSPSTVSNWIIARVSLISSVSSVPMRLMLIVTSTPASPLSICTAVCSSRSVGNSVTAFPSMLTMRSPA